MSRALVDAHMASSFFDLTPSDFTRLLRRYAWERSIDGIHLHHSGRARDRDGSARAVLDAMWSEHTGDRGWSDLAQHLTIACDGTLWTGRDWNRPPCSVSWKNGTRGRGPFMIVLLGDFDDPTAPPSAAQLAGAVEAIARLQIEIARLREEFRSASDRLSFHRDLDPARGRTCPGAHVDRETLSDAIAARRRVLEADRPPRPIDAPPFGDDVEQWYQFITMAGRVDASRDEPRFVPTDTCDLPPRDRGCDARRAP